MKKLLLAFLIFTGCIKEEEHIEWRSAGLVRDAEVIPTSFNESVKMRIKTDSVIVIIFEIATVELGKEAFIGCSGKKEYFLLHGYNYTRIK